MFGSRMVGTPLQPPHPGRPYVYTINARNPTARAANRQGQENHKEKDLLIVAELGDPVFNDDHPRGVFVFPSGLHHHEALASGGVRDRGPVGREHRPLQDEQDAASGSHLGVHG